MVEEVDYNDDDLTRPSEQSTGNMSSGELENVIRTFHATVRAHFRGPLKPPFNEQARKAAGFGPQWYEPLAVKEVSLK